MADVKTLGLRADSSGLVKATGDLEKVAAAADKADASAGRFTDGQRKMIQTMQQGSTRMTSTGQSLRVVQGGMATAATSTATATTSLAAYTGGTVAATAGSNGLASAAGRMAGVMLGAVAAAFAGGKIAQTVDEWSDLQSVVGSAIGSMEAAPAVMQQIVSIAGKRIPL